MSLDLISQIRIHPAIVSLIRITLVAYTDMLGVIPLDSPSTPSSSTAASSTPHAAPSSQSATVKNTDPSIGYYPPNAWSTVSGTSNSASLNVPSCSDSGQLKESSTKGSNISYSFVGKLMHRLHLSDTHLISGACRLRNCGSYSNIVFRWRVHRFDRRLFTPSPR
jgi:hypothetical protein